MSNERNLVPGGRRHKKKCRRYKVQRLPAAIQEQIGEGFARGDSFRAITARVRDAGHRIGVDAIRRYWHAVWNEQHERLRNARLIMAALKHAMQLAPSSPSGQLAEELLYTMVCMKLEQMEEEPSRVLLQEAREQEKVGGKRPAGGKRERPQGLVEEARAVRRRWRELYGLEEADDDEEQG